MSLNGGSFWPVISIMATAIGSAFFFIFAHAGEPTHPGAAGEGDVKELSIQFAAIDTDVSNNKMVLQEVKADVKALRVQQNQDTETILQAIRNTAR